MEVPAENIFEYEWPPKSGEKFFLQEQITEFLQVKSFKRKYPDLTRRAVSPEEREFLRSRGAVTETQLDLGLTALSSLEVHDLMSQDYSDQYANYQRALSEKNKQEIAARQKEYETIKSDSKKMAELRKKAMQSAADWNLDSNRDRHRDRRGFWELQTMTIHRGRRPWKQSRVRPSPYPVAVISGQFGEFYKKFSPSELLRLPLSSVTDVADLLPVRQPRSPPPIFVHPSELQNGEEVEEAGPETGEKLEGAETNGDNCAFCREPMNEEERFVACAQCGTCAHPPCLDMNEDMYNTVIQYDWKCMDCKPCSVCTNLDQEDKMLFCDRCDRGYHTFCVGLEELPTGRWICAKFCEAETSGPRTPDSTRHSRRCHSCGKFLTRENKLYQRNPKFRNLCVNCISKK